MKCEIHQCEVLRGAEPGEERGEVLGSPWPHRTTAAQKATVKEQRKKERKKERTEDSC